MQITLPISSGGTYNFTVDWGDGTTSKVTAHNSDNKSHTYASSGEYTINITGKIEGFGFNNQGDRKKLISIKKWGPLKLGNGGGYFYGASNLKTIEGKVDLTGTTNLADMFNSASKFNGNISNWNTSSVTRMQYIVL